MKGHKPGGIEGFLACILVIIVLFGIIAFSIDLNGDMIQSRSIIDTMRKYVLIMEGNGCLTASEQQALTMELEQMGVSNITYLVDPKVKVSYGSEVVLSISAEVDALKITGMDGFKLTRKDDGIYFEKTLKSTAQY